MQPGTRLGACLLAVGLGLPGLAAAQEEGPAVPIRFDVQVVRGSNQIVPARMDPECAEIRRRLPMPFSTLEMLARRQLQLRFGEKGRVLLPTGRELHMIPISVVRNHLHVHLQVQGLVDTRLQMKNRVPVIVGGESHEGGQIIVMLTPIFGAYVQERRRPTPLGPDLHRVNQPR